MLIIQINKLINLKQQKNKVNIKWIILCMKMKSNIYLIY
jgi:hypothetical protein